MFLVFDLLKSSKGSKWRKTKEACLRHTSGKKDFSNKSLKFFPNSMEPLPTPSTRNMPKPPFGGVPKKRNTGASKTPKKPSEDQSDAAAALMHEWKKGKKKMHDAHHCWQLHPELRPPQSSKSGALTSNQTPNTQLVEVKDGHESEVSIFFTEAASKPIVLDSGATHHLINNPNVFHKTAETNIKIARGGHSNFLNATAAGTATLINHRGGRLVLENTLLVPTLNRSLISIPRLFNRNIVINKTAEQGASIVIHGDFQLLGSLENNLLELCSSHFEVINSHSTCYHSSPDNPYWHARLGNPNQQFQSLIVP
ncbi:hypothetical protein VP01_6314g1, partial [Puccinia sorghi]